MGFLVQGVLPCVTRLRLMWMLRLINIRNRGLQRPTGPGFLFQNCTRLDLNKSLVLKRHLWFSFKPTETIETDAINDEDQKEYLIDRKRFHEVIHQLYSDFQPEYFKSMKSEYESKLKRKVNSSPEKKIVFAPFNSHRSILKFPVIDHEQMADVESIWVEYTNCYDFDFIKQILVEKSRQGKLRNFWIASIKLSIRDVYFNRDLLELLRKLVAEVANNQNLKYSYFSEDFYDCIIGQYFLARAGLLVKEIHDILKPVFNVTGITIQKIIKCCFLAPVKEGVEIKKLIDILFYIQESSHLTKIGTGFAQHLLTKFTKMLQMRGLATHTRSSVGAEYTDTEISLIIYVIDLHIRLYKTFDFPPTSDILDVLTVLLVDHVTYSQEPLKSMDRADVRMALLRLSTIFDLIFENERFLIQLYGDKARIGTNVKQAIDWFSPGFVSSMVQFCILQQSTNGAQKLSTLLQKLPPTLYDKKASFWEPAYRAAYLTHFTTIKLKQLNHILLEHCSYEECNNLVDLAKVNMLYQSLLKYTIRHLYSGGWFSAAQNMMSPFMTTFLLDENPNFLKINVNSKGRQENLYDPITMGMYIEILCRQHKQQEALEIIEDVVYKLDSIRLEKAANKFALDAMNNYVARLSGGFINGSIALYSVQKGKAKVWNPEKHGITSSFTGDLLVILNDSIHFKVGKLEKFHELLAFKYTRARMFGPLKRLIEHWISTGFEVSDKACCYVLKNTYRDAVSIRNKCSTRSLKNHMDTMRSFVTYFNEQYDLRPYLPKVWRSLIMLYCLEANEISELANFVFWIANKLQYSFYFEAKEFENFSKAELLLKIIHCLLETDQVRLYDEMHNDALNKLGSNDASNIFNKDFRKDASGYLSKHPEERVSHFHQYIQQIFTSALLSYIIKFGAMRHPEVPYVGLQLVVQLRAFGFIDTRMLPKMYKDIYITSSQCLNSLFHLNKLMLSDEWKAARAKRHTLELNNQQNSSSEPTQIMSIEESTQNFEHLGNQLFQGIKL